MKTGGKILNSNMNERHDMDNTGIYDSLSDGRISRRAILKAGAATGIGLAGLSVAGCTGTSSTVTPLPNTGATTMSNVIYYSMTGHTQKMAEVIAEELGVAAASVKDVTGIPENGVMFLGSGCYGSKPGEDLQKFITNNDFTGRNVALFGTSGGGAGKEVESMAVLLKGKGAIVVGSYHTRGKFVLLNLGHPNKDDLDGARKFAREIVMSADIGKKND
jgi:flavodoxin I